MRLLKDIFIRGDLSFRKSIFARFFFCRSDDTEIKQYLDG